MSGITVTRREFNFGIPASVLLKLNVEKQGLDGKRSISESAISSMMTPIGMAKMTKLNFGNSEDELMRINSNISNSEMKGSIVVEKVDHKSNIIADNRTGREEIVITPSSTRSSPSSRGGTIYSPTIDVYNTMSSMSFNKNSFSLKLGARAISAPADEITSIRRGKREIKITNPIFYRCCKLINDDFWVNILVNFSIGKFRKGFSYRDGYLYYKNKDKIYVDPNNPSKALDQVQYFMKTKAGIMSENCRNNENLQMTQKLKDESVESKWSEIKSPNYKNILLERYLEKIKKYYNLNDSETLNLKNMIYISNILGHLNDNIIIENGSIVIIDNLKFDKVFRIFSLDPISKKPKRSTYQSKNVKEISSNKFILNKQLNELLKMLDKKNNKTPTENDKLESTLTSVRNTSLES